MMCFNFFSHGTQDLYPTFLQKQHHFDPSTVSWIVIVGNLGAIVGGLIFGHLSEKIGRVNAITIAALIALPALPLWAFSSTPFLLAIGAFIMQIAVQGAWGVIPAASQRIVAGRGAGDPSGLRLSGGQFPRLLQWPVPGQSLRRTGATTDLRWRWWLAWSRSRFHCDPLQSGAAGGSPEGALSSWPSVSDYAKSESDLGL